MRAIVLPLLLMLATGVAAEDYLAQGFVENPSASSLQAPPPLFEAPLPGNVIGPDQAAAIARAQTGGRVLDVQRVPDQGTGAFAVRLLLDAGRVRTVVVDGQSGQLR